MPRAYLLWRIYPRRKKKVEAKNSVLKSLGTSGTEGASGATDYLLLEVIGLSGKSSKPYCKLGKLLDACSRERDIRGPYNIARYMKSRTGYEVSGVAVSAYLYGEYHPKRAFIAAFAEAFELNHQERSRLAWVYAYDSLDTSST